MGGALADQLTHFLRMRPEDRRIILMAGIAAGFSSVFGTPLAGAIDGMGAHAQCVQMLLRAALSACVVLPAIGAAGITVDNAQVVALPGLGAGLATLQGAVVPGRTFDLARPPAVRGGPLLHAVAALALVAAMEAHAAQLRGVVAVVGQHQG
ncbi:hypothetical protein G6F53_013726 [Rhizopus delemar]|nr:hypothetical protein G6F53_013726 [Rhizopus delemar]